MSKFFIFIGITFLALNGCVSHQHPSAKQQRQKLNDIALKQSIKDRSHLYEVKRVVVLPVAKRNFDLSTGLLMRYFLEQELKSNGFKLFIENETLDSTLRQMGVDSMNTLPIQEMRHIGQNVNAQAVVQITLIDYNHDPFLQKIYVKAKFVMIEVYAGRVIWEKEVVYDKKGILKEPISNITPYKSTQQSVSQVEIKSLAQSNAAKIPATVIDMAVKNLPSSKEASRIAQDFSTIY